MVMSNLFINHRRNNVRGSSLSQNAAVNNNINNESQLERMKGTDDETIIEPYNDKNDQYQ